MKRPKIGTRIDGHFVRNATVFMRGVEVLFGIIWAVDASFKFQSGFLSSFNSLIASAASGQPAWLQGWFSFWVQATSHNPALFVYLLGFLEAALAFALIFGFMRKTAYAGGALLSLTIWSVPEGFGGPYGPSSTDIGTGIIYAVVFLLLLVLNATYKNNQYTLDAVLEEHVHWWSAIAEFNR